MTRTKVDFRTVAFVAVETGLFLLRLFCGGEVRVLSSYASIVLCFLFSLAFVRRGEPLLTAGLAFTVAADTCLVLCDPQRQLLGMGFFLVTQTLYAVHLHRGAKPWLLYARVGLIVAAEALTVAVLRENTDLLAVVSLAYYANLILNILTAATKGKSFRLHTLALILFLLCDTVVGLQVAAGGYLPIAEGSLLYRLLFSGFHLSWFFYLPSQVLLSIISTKKQPVN